MGIESVDHASTDERLVELGYASVIDVKLYQPVIAGSRRNSSFALLHQMQARSLTDAFAARTWFREQVSRPEPADDWLANDGKAVEAQLILLQARLLVDFKKLLDTPTPE